MEVKQDIITELTRKKEELTLELELIITIEKQNEIIQEQKCRIAFLENKIRSKNIIVQGLNESENENYKVLEERLKTLISQKIEVNLKDEEIDQVHRIGKYKGTSRPVCLTVSSTKKKIEILSNKKKLRGSNIYVDRDYSKEDREIRRELFKDQLEARKKGKYAVVKGTKLVVKEKMTSKEQHNREKRPVEVSPEQPKEAEEKSQKQSKEHDKKKKFFEKLFVDVSPKENKGKGRKHGNSNQ